MDPHRFDALSRSLAQRSTRREAVRRASAGGLLGGLAVLLGLRPAAAQGDSSTCTLDLTIAFEAGPDAGQSMRGELTLEIDPDGSINDGFLSTDDDEFDVVGQAVGRALAIRIDLGDDRAMTLIGTGERDIAGCRGDAAGVASGPELTSVGHWQATGSSGASSAQPTPRSGSSSQGSGSSGGSSSGSGGGNTNPTPEPEPTCPNGQTACGGVCVDLLTDPQHCGECFDDIPVGTVCENGQFCLPLGQGNCAADFQCCSGFCGFDAAAVGGRSCQTCAGLPCSGLCLASFDSDPVNCGSCANVCAAGDSCVSGLCITPDAGIPDPPCVEPPGACTADFQCCADLICETGTCSFCAGVNCNGLCYDGDFTSDPNNCGSCGNVCAQGDTCSGGFCQTGL